MSDCTCTLMERCAYHGEKVTQIWAVWAGTVSSKVSFVSDGEKVTQTYTTQIPVSNDVLLEIWDHSDGYGEPGYVPAQGYDWSGIRDSSPEAIDAMYEVIERHGLTGEAGS